MIKIAHIADVHVKLFKRHEEYRHVFKNLYKSLRENDVKRVVIVGDVLHNKNNLSPEAVSLVSEFLSNISDIASIDIIKGNHDCIVNQPGRLDALSPIINRMKFENVFMYNKSGLVIPYGIDNFVYGIFDVNDKDNWPIHFEKENDKTYIALFHGAVNGAKTDVDYVLKTNNSVSMFDLYDFIFLGDIHKMQVVRNNSNGITDGVYAGSLIQQNFGESLEKGYILWEIDENKKEQHKVQFIKLDSDYGYYTLRLNKTNIVRLKDLIKDPVIPQKPNIRVLLDAENYNSSTIKDIANYINENVKPISISIEADIEEVTNEIDTKESELDNITDIVVQKNLLKQYCENVKLDKEDIEKILRIHEEFYACLSQDYTMMRKGINWNIKNVNFDNTFSYGENNSVNFNKIPGLVGIFSENASGKSALLESVLMCLFNSSSRITKKNLVDIINKNKEHANVEIEFSLNNKDYVIRRTVERRKDDRNRARNNLNIFETTTGQEINVTGDNNTRETEKFIRTLLGSFDEHKLTTFGLQNDLTCFIDMNQGARKTILSKLVGLDIFSELYNMINDECKALKTLISQYTKHDYRAIYKNLLVEKKEIESSISEFEEHKLEIYSEMNDMNSETSRLNAILNSIKVEDIDIQKITREKQLNDEEIESLTLLKSSLEDKITKGKEVLHELNKEIELLDDRDFDSKIKEYNEKLEQKQSITNKTKIISNDVKNHEKSVEVLSKHDWFDTSELCKKCSFLSDAFEKKEQIPALKQQLIDYSNEIAELESWTSENSNVLEESYKFSQLVVNRGSVQHKLELEQSKLTNTIDKLDFKRQSNISITKLIKNFKDNEESIKYNRTIREQLKKIENNIVDSQINISNIEKEISKKNISLGQLQQKIKDIDDSIENLKVVEKSFMLHSVLKNAFSKNGIQLSLIKKIVPKINSEVKKILSNVPNFEIFLEVDMEDQDVYIYIEDNINKRSIELGSGMEKTLAAIALRAAITNMSLLPRCNLFVIDEGFGSLDLENLNSMNLMLGQLKSMFNTVIVISHVTSMQDICDHILEIKKENGYSKISVE